MHSNLNIYRVGQLVALKSSFLGEPVDTIAYVYEAYKIGREPGVSIITHRGVDLGGFSFTEQRDYLAHVADTNFYYEFSNVIKLEQDFRRHVFDQVFRQAAAVITKAYHDQMMATAATPPPRPIPMQKSPDGKWTVDGAQVVSDSIVATLEAEIKMAEENIRQRTTIGTGEQMMEQLQQILRGHK